MTAGSPPVSTGAPGRSQVPVTRLPSGHDMPLLGPGHLADD
jgi:hypothetical protein